jgi:uncharacterized protein (TIGR00255 family)
MTNSMTAFARTESDGISWEIRSVNQRYLDVNFKIPESFRFLEPTLREIIRKSVNRGKIDCSLRVDTENDVNSDIDLNHEVLASLKSALSSVSNEFPNAQAPTTLELLQWPGVLVHQQQDREALGQDISASFSESLSSLKEMRAREGAELKRMIEERLHDLSQIVCTVRDEVSTIQSRQQEKIKQRIQELNVEVDMGRLEQELVYQAQKSDVAEELDRLETHVDEVKIGLASNKPVGRRLDFLMQELNREANTLSSKAIAANTTIAAVELKVIIEQMREQVQNIE